MIRVSRTKNVDIDKFREALICLQNSMSKSPGNKAWPALVLIVLLLIASLFIRRSGCSERKNERHNTNDVPRQSDKRQETGSEQGLIRHPSVINYSKHARCRMKCRHISENEVRQILLNGKINYRKSELNTASCSRRYAVEGMTDDGQEVRIIFAPCNTEETVVTVIDLGKEWQCDCN